MTETKLDPKEERKYEQLKKLGQELHLPIPEHFITLEVFDRNGKLIQKHHQRSHSWTRNAYNLIFSEIAGKNCSDATFEAGKLSGKTTAAVIRFGNIPFAQRYGANLDGDPTWGYRAAAGIATRGILVGSGLNAESFEDYVLQTQITEGTGAGQLNHVASQAHAMSYGALVLTNELVRFFNNNSGGNVDINEVALVGDIHCHVTVAEHFLVSRDHLGVTVTVPDTGQLKVTYTIELTYPA